MENIKQDFIPSYMYQQEISPVAWVFFGIGIITVIAILTDTLFNKKKQ
jgi:hypothetical protein